VVKPTTTFRRQPYREEYHSATCTSAVANRAIGFDNLAPIIWHKIADAQFEAEGNGGSLRRDPEPHASSGRSLKKSFRRGLSVFLWGRNHSFL
jgi:hypothetical protein